MAREPTPANQAQQGLDQKRYFATRGGQSRDNSSWSLSNRGDASCKGLGDRAETKASLVGVLVLLKGSSHVYKTANGREHQ